METPVQPQVSPFFNLLSEDIRLLIYEYAVSNNVIHLLFRRKSLPSSKSRSLELHYTPCTAKQCDKHVYKLSRTALTPTSQIPKRHQIDSSIQPCDWIEEHGFRHRRCLPLQDAPFDPYKPYCPLFLADLLRPLLVCHQMHDEARPVFFSTSTFVLEVFDFYDYMAYKDIFRTLQHRSLNIELFRTSGRAEGRNYKNSIRHISLPIDYANHVSLGVMVKALQLVKDSLTSLISVHIEIEYPEFVDFDVVAVVAMRMRELNFQGLGTQIRVEVVCGSDGGSGSWGDRGQRRAVAERLEIVLKGDVKQAEEMQLKEQWGVSEIMGE